MKENKLRTNINNNFVKDLQIINNQTKQKSKKNTCKLIQY